MALSHKQSHPPLKPVCPVTKTRRPRQNSELNAVIVSIAHCSSLRARAKKIVYNRGMPDSPASAAVSSALDKERLARVQARFLKAAKVRAEEWQDEILLAMAKEAQKEGMASRERSEALLRRLRDEYGDD